MAQTPVEGLVVVATPIGNARDITLRALDVLAGADVLVAEDTRSLRRLLEIHGIALGGRPLWSYHDHSTARDRAKILGALAEGRSVALTSEAGTPLIADPGYALVAEARAAGYPVTAAPGPSALVTALSIAGLPTDQVHFAGFLPSAAAARRRALEDLQGVPGTLVFYESPKRIARSLQAMAEVLGGDRQAVVCRELTKRFEELRGGRLADLATALEAAPVKGEIVVLLAPAETSAASPEEIEAALRRALAAGERTKQAAADVAAETGASRREVYQMALRLLAEE